MSIRQQLALLKTTKPRGRFPSPAWAWPTGERDLLLRAAIVENLDAAAAAYRRWEQDYAFDDVDFAKQRLLVAISHRLPQSLLGAREHARLLGVERRLWTELIMRLRTTAPALAALDTEGVEVMVLKGAVRTVLNIGDLRGRYAAELDLLVRPTDFERAWKAICAAGWQYVLGYEPNLNAMMGANLSKPGAGELDLHKYPYHQLIFADLRPDDLWARAIKTSFLGHPVFIPSPTDRLLMAIAHGGIDGHVQSDWLVDCALIVRGGTVDWGLFLALARARRVEGLAAVILSYLASLEVAVPQDVLGAVETALQHRPLRRMAAVLQARPKREHSPISALGRGLARALRMARKRLMISALSARAVPHSSAAANSATILGAYGAAGGAADLQDDRRNDRVDRS